MGARTGPEMKDKAMSSLDCALTCFTHAARVLGCFSAELWMFRTQEGRVNSEMWYKRDVAEEMLCGSCSGSAWERTFRYVHMYEYNFNIFQSKIEIWSFDMMGGIPSDTFYGQPSQLSDQPGLLLYAWLALCTDTQHILYVVHAHNRAQRMYTCMPWLCMGATKYAIWNIVTEYVGNFVGILVHVLQLVPKESNFGNWWCNGEKAGFT